MSDTASHTEGVQSEEALLLRAKTDPQGVAVIYDLYADKIYGFLLKRCGHKETAEDLVSKVFMKFIENLPGIEWQDVSIGAYLYRAATNALTDHWRSAKVRLDVEVDENWDPASTIDQPAWHAELSLERDKLAEIIKSMSPRDQQILDLKFFAGLEPEEIAKLIDITPNHASVLVYRALGRLRTKYHATYVRQS
ncbi:sigma-70 family RNA polymerase sigma factor [Candidatus Uhrbacteria bacterium]|nr:sigma-70 family RNA polymerase sigma factor [Candidatus Uhrbacteria bacterium]